MSTLAPPEPSQDDRAASVDLSKQPIEKIFRLLAYELMQEEKRAPERRLGIRQFQLDAELGCQDRLLRLLQEASEVSEVLRDYHRNVTSTAGLFWLLHRFPEEHSWVWLLAVSHDRVLRKVGHYFLRLSVLAVDDFGGCLSPGFRTLLMNAAVSWRKLHGDYIALLWNGVAFGVLGDVTSWRELTEDGEVAEPGPGGPPPNVSWSENLIFGNMWISSVQRWLDHHAQELTQYVYQEVVHVQRGLPNDHGREWRHGKDGVLSSFEFIRRQTFSGWALDKGLLRGVLRHCVQPDYEGDTRSALADFGAGGGLYSEWLNDTGLVDAFAFDGTRAVADVTGGGVLEVDLARDVRLWRTFDWVLCLEVAAHMPAAHAAALLQNIRRHATRGLVMSWSSDRTDPDHVNPLPEEEFVALVERETGFSLDHGVTETVRRGCELSRTAETVAVFKAPV